MEKHYPLNLSQLCDKLQSLDYFWPHLSLCEKWKSSHYLEWAIMHLVICLESESPDISRGKWYVVTILRTLETGKAKPFGRPWSEWTLTNQQFSIKAEMPGPTWLEQRHPEPAGEFKTSARSGCHKILPGPPENINLISPYLTSFIQKANNHFHKQNS